MCPWIDEHAYYEKYYLDGTCPWCNVFALLIHCIQKSEDREFFRMVVDVESFKYVSYELDGGKERKKCSIGEIPS